MNFKKILAFISMLAIGQDLMSAGAASAATGTLVRRVGTKAIAQNRIPLIPSLVSSTTGTMTGGSTPMEQIQLPQVEIPKARLAQYMGAFQEAMQYGRSVAQTPMEFQSPLKFQKPVIVGQSPVEAKAFLDLQLVNLLKNREIDYPAFLNNMIALAAMYGFYKLIDFLNNLYENNTILMWAVEADNENAVEYLLRLGADIHKKNSDGDTAMIIAAKYSNAKMVKFLIDETRKKYADDPNKAQEEVEKLLDAQNKEGRTALLDVIEYGGSFNDLTTPNRFNIIILCLNNGADLSIKDKDGDNVLFLLAKKMKAVSDRTELPVLKKIFDYFVQVNPNVLHTVNGAGNTLLLQSVMDGNLPLFDSLEEAFVDVTQSDQQRQNLIFKAIQSSDTNMVSAVLKFVERTYDDSIRPISTQGDSSAQVPVTQGEKKPNNVKLKELLATRNKEGKTALDYAVEKKSLPLIELLVKKGAQPTGQQLSTAISQQNLNLVEFFLEESKLSPTEDNLRAALHFKDKDMKILRRLLHSPNISSLLKDSFIKETLAVSLREQDTKMFDFLLPMANRSIKEHVLKGIVATGNPAIINKFLKSPEITDEMRQKMLQDAVMLDRSGRAIQTLLSDPSSQKAYENSSWRLLILREALRNVKTGHILTEEDLKKDPVLGSLVDKWKPKYEPSEKYSPSVWSAWVSDPLASWRKKPTSKDEFEKQQKQKEHEFKQKKDLYRKDIEKSIADENQNRVLTIASLKTAGMGQ